MYSVKFVHIQLTINKYNTQKCPLVWDGHVARMGNETRTKISVKQSGGKGRNSFESRVTVLTISVLSQYGGGINLG
jgi:hypothetical protein